MSDVKPGDALTQALKERQKRYDSAAANKAIERMFVRDSEMTREQHEQVQPKLKQDFLSRNPHFLGS